ncbi:MAG: DUF4856 domain-containing protein [Bacteroidota bacterium]|nr:DUF4856 domain-containing protein [Bacteroidota bacterium]
MRTTQTLRFIVILAFFGLFACDDKDEKPSLRTHLDYSALTGETTYPELFVDVDGNSTVDLAEGNDLLKMFQALNNHSSASVRENTPIDGDVLQSMFTNTGDPFYDFSTIAGEDLNASSAKLRDVVASSLGEADAEAVREKIENYFTAIDQASQSIGNTASAGNAGKLGNYLLDEKGLEIAQLIQKSLIGALQLDYIGNVLLDEGLNADNYKTIDGSNYTALEHNWDVAYGLLTLNPIYLEGATDAARNSAEFGLGSYIWEYNKANYAVIYPAFLKGRAAIVNNDRAEYQALAIVIRTEMEKAIAGAAVGYLNKWKIETDPARAAHAIGEGAGFIYSLRFAEMHGADAEFSDAILGDLLGSDGGFWDLEAQKINAAIEAIEAKFAD